MGIVFLETNHAFRLTHLSLVTGWVKWNDTDFFCDGISEIQLPLEESWKEYEISELGRLGQFLDLFTPPSQLNTMSPTSQHG